MIEHIFMLGLVMPQMNNLIHSICIEVYTRSVPHV